MEIIDEILSTSYFKDNPPVLIDVGASGTIHNKWKDISLYSICICFDADEREFKIDEIENSGYKRLIKINRALTEYENSLIDFYLTDSPYCSSTLEPQNTKLKPWLFSNYFNVIEIQKIGSTTINNVLKSLEIKYVDWLKLDTQGTDLRLFTSLPQEIKEGIIAAEFEPGIIDAYKGEDKLYSVLKVMHESGYWLSSMDTKGTQRIENKYIDIFGLENINRTIPASPGWAEMTYLKEFDITNIRSLLLLYVLALLQKQYGFALEVCYNLKKIDDSPIVDRAIEFVFKIIKDSDLKHYSLKSRVKNYLLRKLNSL